MSERLTQTALARHLGISETAVRKHIRNGLYAAGRDGLFDAEQCKALWLATRDPDKAIAAAMAGDAVRKGPAPELTNEAPRMHESNLAKARTAAAAIQAQRAALALQRDKGEVILRSDAQAACAAVAHELKTRLEGLASAAAPVVHAAPTVAEAEVLLRGMVRAVLAEVAKLGEAVDAV